MTTFGCRRSGGCFSIRTSGMRHGSSFMSVPCAGLGTTPSTGDATPSVTPWQRLLRWLRLLHQRHAQDLLVVADEDAAIRVGRMRPGETLLHRHGHPADL